jgi:phosphonate transport system substrate-binding protein
MEESVDDRLHVHAVEDPAVYENIFKPFTTHLSKCLDKKVVFYQVQSNAAEIEAMRSGRLHVGGFSTGPRPSR